jgi:hypothetical protein
MCCLYEMVGDVVVGPSIPKINYTFDHQHEAQNML